MQMIDGGWVFSPTDLVARMECDHRTALDLALSAGILEATPGEVPGMMKEAAKHGLRHEQRILEQLRTEHAVVVEIGHPPATATGLRQAAQDTADALRAGAGVVYQACFFDGSFVGFADFVIRSDDGFDDDGYGDYGYEVYDTKLSRHAKPGALLQLAAYSDQLHRLGHPMPRQMHVWLGDDHVASYAVDDVLPKLDQVRADLRTQLDRGPAVPDRLWGDKRVGCAACPWAQVCDEGRDQDRDLSLVAGIRADQRRKLRDTGLVTLEQLGAAADDQRPPDLGAASFDRLRAQAALQAQQDATRSEASPDGEVTAEYFSHDGIRFLPPASPGDVWFDMEGDPFAEQGRGLEYLFGYSTSDDSASDALEFTPIWAHSPAQEKAAFERFVDAMQVRIRRWPDMHIYHYANYEHAALSRLAGAHGTRENEIDDWLRQGRLIDLMKVFKGSFRVSQRSYSIKKLEALYGLVRAEEITNAGDSVVDYEVYLDLTAAGEDSEAQARLAAIAEYNEVDCRSTMMLDRWMRPYRDSLSVLDVLGSEGDPDAGSGPGRAPQEDEDSRYQRLIEDVPDHDRTPLQQARAMMRAAAGYFRREGRSQWWEHFNRLDAPHEDWETDREVLVVTSGHAEPWVPKRTNYHRAATLTVAGGEVLEYAPGDPVFLVYDQATDSMHTGQSDGRGWTSAKVVSHDGDTLRVKSETVSMARAPHQELPAAVFPEAAVRSGTLSDSARTFADHWVRAMPDAPQSAVTDLLLRRSPRLTGDAELPRTGDHCADVEQAIRRLDHSYLAVQGPPGSGKTYLAAEVIVALVRSGQRIGVVAQSHRAIENVLDQAVELGLHPDQIAKKPKSDTDTGTGKAYGAGKAYHRADPAHWLAGRSGGALVGGTAWVFCSSGMADQLPLDLLVIDEAGQYALGYTIALWRAARNILLLGDPQQLPQVSQGTHPEPVDTAALDWLAAGEPVLPARFGYFLNQTRRMNPDLTRVVSRLSYARRLTAHPVVNTRHVDGIAAGVHPVPVDHHDRAAHSPEEVDVVVDLVRRNLGAAWTDKGRTRPIGQDDLLVVAPFNAQVDAIRRALRAGGLSEVRVGTVDKFQGQEAPIVVVSMTTSSRDDVPRGMGFVLSRNRLNVAVSRAQWASCVVYSRALGDHSPTSSDELVMLGAFLGVVGEGDEVGDS